MRYKGGINVIFLSQACDRAIASDGYLVLLNIPGFFKKSETLVVKGCKGKVVNDKSFGIVIASK